ncbi:MAG: hypothetical protein FJ356_00490 [Thaumarchaeota archaeon]|nr:hypothetical protein [Nitrososphaerota archaeon]
MKTKRISVISGIIAFILILIAISQMDNFGTNLESAFADKSYSQIQDYEVRNAGGTIFLSVKTKSDLPNTSEDFEKSKVISFGYAWLMQDNDGSLEGIFSNVHTIGGFIGPWHSEIVRLVPMDDIFCLLSEPMINVVSAGDNLVRTILSEDQLDFSSHEIDRAVSVVILENLSCSSGFEAKIILEFKKG